MSFFEQTGDGSVFTSVRDLLQWDRNFYEGTVGGRPLVEQLTTPGKLRDGQPLRYALGLSVDRHRGLARVSHGGSWAGYRAELMRFPEQRLSVACLCNLSTARPSRLAAEVAEVYLGPGLSPSVAGDPAAGREGAPDPKPSLVTASAAELAAYAGRYYSAELDTAYTVEVKGGGLALRGRRVDATLAPTARDEFTQGALVVRFERDGQGRPAGFLLGQDRIRNLRFTRSAP
jgi:hypothetical protein